jgi:hypothetical protein
MSNYPAWKPSPRHSAMMAEPPTPPAPTAQAVSHDWGFGARGAAKAWSPPPAPAMPSDWWKSDRKYA